MTDKSLPTPIGKQREVLYLPAEGHTVVLGTAGSGKTTLAILRALHLADPTTDHGGPTLLLTFIRSLVTYMRHLTPMVPAAPEVTNYHRFARGYLSSRGLMEHNSICGSRERSRLIEAALDAAASEDPGSSLLKRLPGFVDDEIRWLQHNGIADLDAYVAAERVGRAANRVPRAERPLLFRIYESYLTRRQQGGWQYDWDDMASSVLREFVRDAGPRRFRHVVIDEGQDFSPEMLRSLAAAIPSAGSLTFFGDMAQQIFGHRISWRSAGLTAAKLWRFEQNYRNTQQIARLALALARMPGFPDDPDLVEPVSPTAEGPLPAFVRHSSEESEFASVVSQAAGLARTGTVAILFRTRKQEKWARRRLPMPATRLQRKMARWPPGPGLFHGTYHSAKGLEFDAVFLPFLSESRWPHPPDLEAVGPEEAARRDSRLLYVGITRARFTLVLSYTGRSTPLLPAGSGLYQTQ